MSKDHKVGKGKPPKHSQFKKGQSGNPNGRPRGNKNSDPVLHKMWNKIVTVREGGQVRRVPYNEALIMALADKAIKGSVTEQVKLMKAISDYAPELLQHLKEPIEPNIITVRYILPDGKTVEDYENVDRFGNKIIEHDPNEGDMARATEGSDSAGDIVDDDDSWLD